MSPITRASGTRKVVLARYARNQRLADALYWQAFSAITSSAGARAYYDAQRGRGATHHQALRALANRLVGILHGCLRHKTTYDESTAWPTKIDKEEPQPLDSLQPWDVWAGSPIDGRRRRCLENSRQSWCRSPRRSSRRRRR